MSKKLKFLITWVLLISISIGFAYLTVDISLIGNTKVEANTWDIYFDNVRITDGSVEESTPEISTKTIVNYSVSLDKPGDFYEFTIDAVNDGTIDAMISSITTDTLTEEQSKYLDYNVTYVNGADVLEKHLLSKKSRATYKVKIEYIKDLKEEDLPEENKELTMTLGVDYIQADESAIDWRVFAMFNTGTEINSKMQSLAGSYDNITKIIRTYEITDENKKIENVVSTTDYETPIYMWYEDNTIYYYSDANILYLNTSSNNMFRSLENVEKVDLGTLDTRNVTNMNNMFNGCSSLNSLYIKNFDTSQVTTMQGKFYLCKNLNTLDLSNFDTSQVTNMNYMFYSCINLTSLDLSNFNTSEVTSMEHIFSGCNNLTSLNLSNFDTSKITNMNYMFFSCKSLTTLDLSSFDTSQVTNMSSMFYNCTNLQTIYVSSNFITNNVTLSDSMFYRCDKLTGISESENDYESSITDKTYAKVDGYSYDEETNTWIEDGLPGYFSLKTA